jgi:replicative DNA helicase
MSDNPRVPPHNRDAERGVLGTILRDDQYMPEICARISAESFYVHPHPIIFSAMTAIHQRGQPIDVVMLAEELLRRGKLDELKVGDVPGERYLEDLYDSEFSAARCLYYANIIRDKATVRALIHTANEILRKAYDQQETTRNWNPRSGKSWTSAWERAPGTT